MNEEACDLPSEDYEPVSFQSNSSRVSPPPLDTTDDNYEDVVVRQTDPVIPSLRGLTLCAFVPDQPFSYIDEDPRTPIRSSEILSPQILPTRQSVLKAFDPLFSLHVAEPHVYDDVPFEELRDLYPPVSHDVQISPVAQFTFLEANNIPSTPSEAETKAPSPIYTQVVKNFKDTPRQTTDETDNFFRNSVTGHAGLVYSHDTGSLSSWTDEYTYAALEFAPKIDQTNCAPPLPAKQRLSSYQTPLASPKPQKGNALALLPKPRIEMCPVSSDSLQSGESFCCLEEGTVANSVAEADLVRLRLPKPPVAVDSVQGLPKPPPDAPSRHSFSSLALTHKPRLESDFTQPQANREYVKESKTSGIEELAFKALALKKFKVPSFRSYYDSSASNSRKASPSPSPSSGSNEEEKGNEGAGYVHWHALSKKESQLLWTDIREGMLVGAADHRGGAVKYSEPLKRIISLSALSEKTPLEHDTCEIATVRDKKKTLVLALTPPVERNQWLKLLLDRLTPAFRHLPVKEFSRAGKVYLKEGVSGSWVTAWLLLENRNLHRRSVTQKRSTDGPILTEDLRKTRNVGFTPFSEEGCCPWAVEPGPILVINLPDVALYVQSDLKMETENWCKYVKTVSVSSGRALDEQQLTAHDVPVLVEKCMKFVSTHGSLSEGIYRRSGVTSKVHKLLTALKQDASNFHISIEEYSEHDVANALKRFFRTLPEPLLTNRLYSKWVDALQIKSHEQRLKVYQDLLSDIPPINYRTIQALMGHLHSIHDQCEKNLMPVGNLASLWGPTLMTVENGPCDASSFSYTHAETDVVLQLIQYYPWLFDVDTEALERERTLQEAMARMQSGNVQKKTAGDMRLWIYTSPQPNADTISITVNPNRTVKDVRDEIARKHSGSYSARVLIESVCNGHMKRPLHAQELVLPVILRWAQWPQDDCTNNRIIFCDDNFLLPLLMGVVSPPSMFMVLRYADPKTKSFKKCPVEFCQARITCLKDTKNHTIHAQWDIENLVWYYGTDSKRSPPTKWAITFVKKDEPIKRSKDSPYFGHTLCFSNEDEYSKFTTALLLTERAEGGLSAYLHQ